MPSLSRKQQALLFAALAVVYLIAYFYLHRNDTQYKILKFNVTCVPAGEVTRIKNFILTTTNEEFGPTKTPGRWGNLIKVLYSPLETEPVIKREVQISDDGYFYIDSIPAYEYLTMYFETPIEKNTESKVMHLINFDQPRDTFSYTFCMTENLN